MFLCMSTIQVKFVRLDPFYFGTVNENSAADPELNTCIGIPLF